MVRNVYDIRRQEAEAERLATEARLAQQKADQAKAKAVAEAAFKAESVKKTNDYVRYRAELQLEAGRVNPKVIKAYLEQYDLKTWDGQTTYIKAVRKLLSNPLYGVTKTTLGYRFNENDFFTVKALHEAISGQLGVELETPDIRWFELALVNSLNGVTDEHYVNYRLAIEPIKEAPEDVALEDYFRMETLGLANGLLNPSNE